MSERTVANHHPLVHGLEAIMRARDTSPNAVSERAGMAHNAISRWMDGCSPGIANFDAALNVLGFRLAIAPISDDSEVIAQRVRRP